MNKTTIIKSIVVFVLILISINIAGAEISLITKPITANAGEQVVINYGISSSGIDGRHRHIVELNDGNKIIDINDEILGGSLKFLDNFAFIPSGKPGAYNYVLTELVYEMDDSGIHVVETLKETNNVDVLINIIPIETPIPTPIPTLIPTPIPTVDKINLTVVVTSSPTVSPTSSPVIERVESNQFGVAFIDSTPRGALVKIDGRKAGYTPLSRDLSPKGYNISLEMDGYITFQKSIIIHNQEDYPINVNFNDSKITIESDKIIGEIKLSSLIQEENQTDNTTNGTTQIATKNNGGFSIFTIILFVLAAAAIGGLAVFIVSRIIDGSRVADTGEDVTDNEISVADTQDKVLGLIKNNPNFTNTELASVVGISERTLSRRIKELKYQKKL